MCTHAAYVYAGVAGGVGRRPRHESTLGSRSRTVCVAARERESEVRARGVLSERHNRMSCIESWTDVSRAVQSGFASAAEMRGDCI